MRRLVAAAALTALLALTYAPMPADAAPAQNNASYHIVKPGETLYGIAAYYGSSAGAIAKANGIVNYDMIYAGQSLAIPGGGYHPAPPVSKPVHGGTYVVRHGDTLYSIAASHGTTVSALMAANGISNPDYIRAGQTLTIPGGSHGGYPPSHGNPSHQPAPGCGHYYRVKPGDTLSRIAYSSGTTTYALARANNLSYPYTIYAGQSLHIPCDGGTPKPKHQPKRDHKPDDKHEPKRDQRPNHCAPDVIIYEPRNGDHLSGTVHIVGTANIKNFQFYKIEYAMGRNPEDRMFNSIGDTVDTPVKESTLAVWYVGNMPGGDYTLRLTAVDEAGQYPRPCDVRVRIND